MLDLPSYLELLGDRVTVLHSPHVEAELGGGDIDCTVSGFDPTWARRLPEDVRLCQCMQYDVTGWYWVLDDHGQVVKIDTLIDPRGLGRYGFSGTEIASNRLLDDVELAVYLTAKRLRKRDFDYSEWNRISSLSVSDPERYVSSLSAIVGRRTATELRSHLIAGKPITPALMRKSRGMQTLRRFRTPKRSAIVIYKAVQRALNRILHPSGLVVLVAGPDGSGKSTLTEMVSESMAGFFRRYQIVHWKASALPRRREEADDAASPHGRATRSMGVSMVFFAYHFLDALLGAWLRVIPAKLRSSLVFVERGWWDTEVDPHRYRLDIPTWCHRVTSALMPRPDMAFLLEASPESILSRKNELDAAEMRRQMKAWREAVPRNVEVRILDASLDAVTVSRVAREALIDHLSSRQRLRSSQSVGLWKGKLLVPRNGRAASESLRLIPPITLKRATVLLGARLFLASGGGKLLRSRPLPSEVEQAIRSATESRERICVLRGNGTGRWIVGILDRDGRLRAVAKVRRDEESLDREVSALSRMAAHLPLPLTGPRLIDIRDGLVVMEAVKWAPRLRGWTLAVEAAEALGAFWASAGTGHAGTGFTHGDFAPWNLLPEDDRWVLLDWEAAVVNGSPFYDLFHFWVQSCVLLGRPNVSTLFEGVAGRGHIGKTVRAYCTGAGLPPASAREGFDNYLEASKAMMDPSRPDIQKVISIRDKLLSMVK